MANQAVRRQIILRSGNLRSQNPRVVPFKRESSLASIEDDVISVESATVPREQSGTTIQTIESKSATQTPTDSQWSTGKTICIIISISVACLLVALAAALAVVLTRPSVVATTPTTASTNLDGITALWTFDGITTDSFGNYNGTLLNGASFSPVQNNQPYIGNGNALFLNNSVLLGTNQTFGVTTFFNLSYQSFTIEAWVYVFSISGDNPVLSQCQCATCAGQCLSVLIRSGRLFMTFTLNDLSGTTSISANTWAHVAYVYDSSTSRQIMYLNGIQDAIKSSASPYQGQNGSIHIGAAVTLTQTSFFNGYIDHVRITTRAKSASEILTSATLMAYYSFDLPDQARDSGPNSLHGMIISGALVSGRVNQGLGFSGSNSFFQAYGFYQLGWGVLSNRPFTIALWINPTSTRGSTIVQVSPFQNSTFNPAYIMNLIGFVSSGGMTRGQLATQLYAWPTVFGPYLTLNTWTHVAFTFSPTNGNTQYVNGVAVGTTGAVTSSNVWNSIMWLHIGYTFCWSSAYIPCNAYQGSVDELYIYSRELSATEIAALANP